MYSKPICEKGAREPLFWYEVKKVWLQVKYIPKYNSISKKEFFTNFLKYCEIISKQWDRKDKQGNIKIPTADDYDYASMNCFSKYKWDECFEQYEEAQMTNSERRVLKNRRKRKEPKTNEDWDLIDDIDEELRHLMEGQKQGEHNEYRIAKLIETKVLLESHIDDRLDLNKEEDHKDSEVMTVPVKPEHEDQHIRDIWTERAKQDVIPR